MEEDSKINKNDNESNKLVSDRKSRSELDKASKLIRSQVSFKPYDGYGSVNESNRSEKNESDKGPVIEFRGNGSCGSSVKSQNNGELASIHESDAEHE